MQWYFLIMSVLSNTVWVANKYIEVSCALCHHHMCEKCASLRENQNEPKSSMMQTAGHSVSVPSFSVHFSFSFSFKWYYPISVIKQLDRQQRLMSAAILRSTWERWIQYISYKLFCHCSRYKKSLQKQVKYICRDLFFT